MEMQTKKSLLMVDPDEQMIKIICGNKIKCIKLSDIENQNNIEFLKVLFIKTEVMKIDKVSKVSIEDFYDFSLISDKKTNKNCNFPAPVIASPAKTRSFISDSEQWIKSNLQSITIIDDLKIGTFFRDGIEVDRCLVLEPGNPVNLASIDKLSLSASKTLSKLMEKGDISRIPSDEAMVMLEKFNNRVVLSVHDEVPQEKISTKAIDLANKMFDEDVDTINIEDENPQNNELLNEGGSTMQETLEQISKNPNASKNTRILR